MYPLTTDTTLMARMTRSVCWQSAVAPSSPFREEQAVGLPSFEEMNALLLSVLRATCQMSVLLSAVDAMMRVLDSPRNGMMSRGETKGREALGWNSSSSKYELRQSRHWQLELWVVTPLPAVPHRREPVWPPLYP